MKKVGICVPHNYPNIEKVFGMSLMTLMNVFHMWNYKEKKDYALDVYWQNQGWIDFMRNVLAQTAIENEADYTMWLDTDMSFPPDIIIKMLRHFEENDELEAVSGLYNWKKPPFIPHVYPRFDNGKLTVAGGFPLDKPFEVAGAGFGCIMIKTDVFKRMEKPWFIMNVDHKNFRMDFGEDLYFCKNAKMNMICDPTIVCNHLNQVEININHYIAGNDLEIKDNEIQIDKKKLDAIYKQHEAC